MTLNDFRGSDAADKAWDLRICISSSGFLVHKLDRNARNFYEKMEDKKKIIRLIGAKIISFLLVGFHVFWGTVVFISRPRAI